MDKLFFLEDKKSVIWATADDRDSRRGSVICPPGTVGFGALGSSEKQMREAFDLYRKHTGQSEPRAQTWIPFDRTNPPPPGDYWCEVPALKLRNGGCLCRALYWTGERWEGPGGEYEVGRFVPEMLPQLHGRGDDASERTSSSAIDDTIEHLLGDISALSESIAEDEARAKARKLRLKVCRVRANALHHMAKDWLGVAQKMADDGADWNLDAAIARISELESDRSAMALRIERLSAELAKPENVRLREVTEAMAGRAVMFDDIAARVRHELCELDTWIARAGEAERKLAEANARIADLCCDRHREDEEI